MADPDTIEGWPPLSTNNLVLAPDGTAAAYWPNTPSAWPPETELEGYGPVSTAGVGVDPDGVVWLYHPPSGGMIDLTPLPPAPVNTTPPVIQVVSGNPEPGQQAVNSTPGVWSPPQTGGYRRQWRKDGAAIPGATGTMYTIQEGDVGGALQCGVIAVGDGGESQEALSNTLTVVEAPPEEEEPAARAAPKAKAKKKR